MLDSSKIIEVITGFSPLIGAIITCAGNLWINRTKSKTEVPPSVPPNPGVTNIYNAPININITINGLYGNQKGNIDYKMNKKSLKERNKRSKRKTF
jgi:hypothetical protein